MEVTIVLFYTVDDTPRMKACWKHETQFSLLHHVLQVVDRKAREELSLFTANLFDKRYPSQS